MVDYLNTYVVLVRWRSGVEFIKVKSGSMSRAKRIAEILAEKRGWKNSIAVDACLIENGTYDNDIV